MSGTRRDGVYREAMARHGYPPEPPAPNGPRGAHSVGTDDHTLDGAAFILDAPEAVPAVVGDDDHVVWAAGEPFLLVGPAGVGKTTFSTQLALAMIGLLGCEVLGLPVQQHERVLYMAMDRAPQTQRAFRRLVSERDRAALEQRLVAWKGPPPRDLARYPETLTELCRAQGATAVYLDSLKDAARNLSDDETGSGLNTALQAAVAAGIEVAGNHHQRKGREGRMPTTLEDVYGSTWVTAGAGSVVLLWGAAGDAIVDWRHLKQPAAEVGPWKLEHDHVTGLSSVYRGQADPLVVLRGSPHGTTANDLARLMFEKAEPNDNERRKAQRRLDQLVKRKLAHRTEPALGGADRTTPARYYATTGAEER